VQDAPAAADGEPASDHVPVSQDAEYFEHLIMDAVTAERADETWWHGVLRTDPHTFCAITTADGKDAVEREIEKSRRVLAMVFARTLQAYGVRPDMPARWQDRRDPHTQEPKRGGRRSMDHAASP
jgi:hypothetical protein